MTLFFRGPSIISDSNSDNEKHTSSGNPNIEPETSAIHNPGLRARHKFFKIRNIFNNRL